MKQSPVVARWLLGRFASCTPAALQGDIEEEFQSGRSSAWYWRQVVGAIVAGSFMAARVHPLLALRAIATGWIVLLLFFFACGDVMAETLARYAWNWKRSDGYGYGVWWPFHIAGFVVSYLGFGLSALAIARIHAAHAMPMVLAYLVSVVSVLAASAAMIEWINGPIGAPHTLYFLVSVVLPFMWRSGFVLVPLVIFFTGLFSCRTAVEITRAGTTL